ncbi:MAG TPA: LuxR C-terminal-related transcriptional regulator [Paludibacter sp.]|nr:LuxR C-terminal-related transcriptional regulator [Paludibacter sp.]
MKIVRTIFFCLSLLLVACSAPDKELLRADQLMETAPDSALHILQRLKPDIYKRNPNRALYALLMSQALDKNDIKVESDSLIRFATNYYTDSQPLRAAYAYFYLARCENNQGNKQEQALALFKAQEFASKCQNYKLRGLIYYDKALMYQSQRQPDSMILYNKLCFSAFEKIKDIRNQGVASISIGNGFCMKDQYDSAKFYYNLAEKIAMPLHEDAIISSIYKHLSGIAYQQKNYQSALHYLRLTPITNIAAYDYNRWYLIGRIFVKSSQLDSAKIYLSKVEDPNKMVVDYYQLWQELYEKQGQLPKALHFAKRVIEVKDSIQERTLTTSFAGLEKKYRFERLAVENKSLIIENNQNGIILLVALLLLSLVCIVFLFWRIKANRHQLIAQKQLLKQEKTLMKTEKENNILLQKQVSMQRVLLKNVEQYRSQAVKRPPSTEDNDPTDSKIPHISTFHEELIAHIDVAYPNISVRLIESYPNLTKRDVLICCLLLGNFDTGMISTILEVKSESVNVHRGRLRKKLQLQNSENLLQFLLKF